MKNVSLVLLAFFVPALSQATSLPSPDAQDTYCVQKATDSIPGFQMQLSKLLLPNAQVQYYIAVKYGSSLSEMNFAGAQTFVLNRDKSYRGGLEYVEKEDKQMFAVGSIAPMFNQRFKDKNSFYVEETAPDIKFYDVQMNADGPRTKSVALRFVQNHNGLEIGITALRKSGISLAEALDMAEKDFELMRMHDRGLIMMNFNVYRDKVTCTTERRYSDREPTPQLIK